LPPEFGYEIKEVELLAFPGRQKQIKKETNRLYANFGDRLSMITVGRLLRYTKTLHISTISASDKEKGLSGQSDIIKQAKSVPIGVQRQITQSIWSQGTPVFYDRISLPK